MNSSNINFKNFSGPFDLLLSLLDEKKMEISEVSISAVTENYLDHLEKIEEIEPVELADFLVLASRLLLLKSKAILPQFLPEEEDDENDLEEQLKLYKKFLELSKDINKKWLDNKKAVSRIEPIKKSEEFLMPENLSFESLEKIMEKILFRIKPPKPLAKTYIDKNVLLRDKIKNIRDILGKKKKLNFSELLGDIKNKTEVIVIFLAILELVKTKNVYLKQKNSFSDIEITQI
jgi:segregation and condensation protein A